jgi:ribosomal protein S18 acetylase RimI-like enzyme
MTERTITLRQREPADEPFLFTLYSAIRAPEFSPIPLSDAQKQQIFRMQYDAQCAAYSTLYPDSDYQLILRNGSPIGRIWVARLADELHLVDIGLLPEARNAGVGTSILRELQREASEAGKPIRCNVHRENPGSLRFHLRLGFQVVYEDPMDLKLEWRP